MHAKRTRAPFENIAHAITRDDRLQPSAAWERHNVEINWKIIGPLERRCLKRLAVRQDEINPSNAFGNGTIDEVREVIQPERGLAISNPVTPAPLT
jgi:hypothetical protein